jgi:AcrR family transcriptional regulator
MDARQAILTAATRLFAERGFDGTSVQEIAEAVGIRKPSLLYHFPSKDALRRAVLGELLERWHGVLPRLLMQTAGGEPRFGDVLEELVRFFTEDPDRARLLVREILDRPDDMRRRLDEHVRPWVGVVGDYIRRAQARGEAHASVDPEAYVLQVINLVVSGVATSASLGSALLGDDAPGRRSGERHVRELVRIARASLLRGPEDREAQRPRRDRPSGATPRRARLAERGEH